MKRSVSTILALVFALSTVLNGPLASGAVNGPATATGTAGVAEQVVGSGFATALACVACVGGGALIAMGGLAAVLAAASQPGSVGALAGCIAVCVTAAKE